MALVTAGYRDEAQAWGQWLRRTVAGSPHQLQIMYGLSGEPQLIGMGVPWLPATGVPLQCASVMQLPLNFSSMVYGELIDAIYQGRTLGLAPIGSGWALQQKLVQFDLLSASNTGRPSIAAARKRGIRKLDL
jgi:GH15 family glucan-1,4-alpha-glucosidase